VVRGVASRLTPLNFKGERMVEGKEFKVIIKKNGHIFYNGELIAILAQWNKYEDLAPDSLITRERK
tara:strand:- start:233 stop:430 length:198 start_codon:yes stop_codon:yes gene_type:complete